MFSYEDIQRYNDTDMSIYRYISSNLDKIPYMTIRELAGETYTSPAAILRFCAKNNCGGYNALKNALKKELASDKERTPSPDLKELAAFFTRAASPAFEDKLAPAVRMLKESDCIIFLGKGSSGALAKYGARYFSNTGKFSTALEDTCYPIDTYTYENAAVVILSESGETQDVIGAAEQFRLKGCRILSITNSAGCTLAGMSDWNFSYHFEPRRVNGNYNATTQVPVLFVIEALAIRI